MNGPCLVRVDASGVDSCNTLCNPTIIYLNKPKITVGRGENVDYRILSRCVATLHAVIKSGVNRNEWLCTGNRDSQGTFLNGRRMSNGFNFILKDGDVVRFGHEQAGPVNCFVCNIRPVLVHSCEGVNEEEKGNTTAERNHDEVRCNENLVNENRLLKEELEKLKAEMQTKKTELANETQELREELVDIKKQIIESVESKNQNDPELITEKKKLESALHHSSVATKALQELVDESKRKISKVPNFTVNSKELSTSLMRILEAEFQCGVCKEVAVESVTLECSHLFCHYCFTTWFKTKGNCPICRKKTYEFVKTIAVDSFVDKVLELLSPELKAQRLETITERKAARESFEREYATAAASHVYLNYSSDDDDDDHDDFDFNGYLRGLPNFLENPRANVRRRFYGGYGNCFVCRQPGHWANSCPFR